MDGNNSFEAQLAAKEAAEAFTPKDVDLTSVEKAFFAGGAGVSEGKTLMGQLREEGVKARLAKQKARTGQEIIRDDEPGAGAGTQMAAK